MNNLRQEVTSKPIFILRLLILFAVSGFIAIQILKLIPVFSNSLFFIIIGGLIYYPLSKISKNLIKGFVNFKMSSKGISIHWEKQLPFQNEPNLFLEWNELKEYSYQPEQYFHLFKVRLKNGDNLNFTFTDYSSNFHRFYARMEKKVLKKSEQNCNVEIKKGKTIYETNYAKISAIISIPLIAFLSYSIMFGDTNKDLNYGLLIVIISNGLFFIGQVFKLRREKR